MTAQIGDSFKYDGENYGIVALSPSDKHLFNPRDHGLNPCFFETSCWDGYYCDFTITDALYLDELHIYCSDHKYPDICGRKVSMPESYTLGPKRLADSWLEEIDYHDYANMELKIFFTGKILMGTGFMNRYYIHMGYQRAYAYEKLLEFEFEKGNVKKMTDLSGKAAEYRKKIEELRSIPDEDLPDPREFVKHSFSLDYGEKTWWDED